MALVVILSVPVLGAMARLSHGVVLCAATNVGAGGGACTITWTGGEGLKIVIRKFPRPIKRLPRLMAVVMLN
jgi:hypothetical protein